MAKKSALLQKIHKTSDYSFQAGGDQMIGYAIELMMITLGDPEAMSGDAFGSERIKRFTEAFKEKHEFYIKAFMSKDPEADYAREKLDEQMRELYGANFVPFEKRYPYTKEIKYR